MLEKNFHSYLHETLRLPHVRARAHTHTTKRKEGRGRKTEKEEVITASINHPGQSLLPGDAGWIKLSPPLHPSIHPSLHLSPLTLSSSVARALRRIKANSWSRDGTLTRTARSCRERERDEGKRGRRRDPEREREREAKEGMLLIHAESFGNHLSHYRELYGLFFGEEDFN